MAGIDLGDCWADGVWEEGVWASGVWEDGGAPPESPSNNRNPHSRAVTRIKLAFRRWPIYRLSLFLGLLLVV